MDIQLKLEKPLQELIDIFLSEKPLEGAIWLIDTIRLHFKDKHYATFFKLLEDQLYKIRTEISIRINDIDAAVDEFLKENR